MRSQRSAESSIERRLLTLSLFAIGLFAKRVLEGIHIAPSPFLRTKADCFDELSGLRALVVICTVTDSRTVVEVVLSILEIARLRCCETVKEIVRAFTQGTPLRRTPE